MFDEAHGSALFLNELGELKPSMLVNPLRVLETGEHIPVGETRAKKAHSAKTFSIGFTSSTSSCRHLPITDYRPFQQSSHLRRLPRRSS
ncbi:MAG: sigma-54 factor interaction domain-containing protein [Desulfobacterales bacterium]|nr:sigma-54 factor interaction domain-containing protein [Desulfobacterales bacterium]